MSAIVAVNLSAESKPAKTQSEHLFVDTESSKNDLDTEMKTDSEARPPQVPVAMPTDKSDWTCPWCYRTNNWDDQRCPACDRFKVCAEATVGYLGDVITDVKVNIGMPCASPILNKTATL